MRRTWRPGRPGGDRHLPAARAGRALPGRRGADPGEAAARCRCAASSATCRRPAACCAAWTCWPAPPEAGLSDGRSGGATCSRRIASWKRSSRRARRRWSAIRRGEVDALVLGDQADDHRVYTLNTADRPYRVLIEQIQEGAVTLAEDGTVLYCNRRLADLLGAAQERVIGQSLRPYVVPEDLPSLGPAAARGRHAQPQRDRAADAGRRRAPGLRVAEPAARRGRLHPAVRRAHRPDRAEAAPARAGRRQRAADGRDRRARAGRGRPAPGAEDGGGGPAHRRPRARLQQPADRHHRQPGAAADARRAGPHRRARPLRRGGPGCGQAGRGPDPPAAGLLAPADAGPEAHGREPPGGRHGGADPAHGGPGDHGGGARGRRLWTTLVRSRPARERAAEPVHQRPRRHAGRRPADDRDGNCWLDERAARERDLSPGQYVSLCVPTPAPACRRR